MIRLLFVLAKAINKQIWRHLRKPGVWRNYSVS